MGDGHCLAIGVHCMRRRAFGHGPCPQRRDNALPRRRRASSRYVGAAGPAFSSIFHQGHPMSLISFIQEAGEKLFNRSAPAAAGPPDVAALNATAGQAIERYIASQGLKADGLDVKYDGATQTVTVAGIAPDQASKEKIVL